MCAAAHRATRRTTRKRNRASLSARGTIYKIDVGLGGERVYFDAFTKERKTVARRQRTHEVKVDDDENVWVKLNKEEEIVRER